MLLPGPPVAGSGYSTNMPKSKQTNISKKNIFQKKQYEAGRGRRKEGMKSEGAEGGRGRRRRRHKSSSWLGGKAKNGSGGLDRREGGTPGGGEDEN